MSKVKLKKELQHLDESFYNGVYNNFVATLKFMAKYNLLDNFKLRAEKCTKWASPCGCGFTDEIADVFYKYYQE